MTARLLPLVLLFASLPLYAITPSELHEFLVEFHSQAGPARVSDTSSLLQSVIGGHERPEDLIDAPELLRNLASMEAQQLREGRATVEPWSGSFWPLTHGLIGTRYADPKFPRSAKWHDNYLYAVSYPAKMILESRDTSAINRLSPAEKYDLLVGDEKFTLSKHMWTGGLKEYSKSCEGDDPSSCQVLHWEGLCHGWAAAAMTYPEPKHAVRVASPLGPVITFYPTDIKALESLLYAYSPPPKKFIGKRCRIKDPKTDEVGRVLDPTCNDINPGSFHTVMVNQIGILKQSLIIDATYDAEVWNYPISHYRYLHFNPQTLQVAQSHSSTVISISDYKLDKFKERTPGTTAVVGVAMDVTYLIPTVPTTGERVHSRTHTVTYVYDLELDARGDVIGGEWYTNRHPDFMWKPVEGAPAVTKGDKALKGMEWDGATALTPEWLKAAQISAQSRVPLASVVNKLSELSQD